MGTITVTELSRQTRAILDRVRAGEHFVITDEGLPVAQLLPDGPTHWEQLVAAGRVHRATARGALDITPIALGMPTQKIIDDIRTERT